MSPTHPDDAHLNRQTRMQRLNDEFRSSSVPLAIRLSTGDLVFSKEMEAMGYPFVVRAFEAVRAFADFTPDLDAYGEHDRGGLSVDGLPVLFKIEYVARRPFDPTDYDDDSFRPVLTIALDEY